MGTKKKRTIRGGVWWIILLLLLVASAAAAAEDTLSLDEVVVTATRYGEQAADVPANVTVITRDDIAASTAQSIPELLLTAPGVQVSDVTANHRSFVVDLRGFGEQATANTLVLVDGRRINEPDLSGTDWSVIPLDRVERIEIIRGGRGAVLYGDNASGGVINIITKEAGGLSGGIDLTGGSYGTLSTALHVGESTKDFSLRMSGKYLTTDGYRDNSKTDSKDVGMNAAYYLGDRLRVQVSGGYHQDKTGFPGALRESDFAAGASRTDSMYPGDFADTEDYYLQAVPEVFFGDGGSVKIDLSYRKRTFLSFSSGSWGNFLGHTEIETLVASPQFVVRKTAGLVKNTVTGGIDLNKSDEDILNNSVFFGSPSTGVFELKKENAGYYLHDEATIADRLRLSAGYRYDTSLFSFDPSSPSSIRASRDLYTAGVNYTFRKKSYAYVNYARSFRYPLMDELYSFITNTISPSLRPQTSDSYEAGVHVAITEGSSAQVSCFRMDTDGEIIYNPVTFANENLDGRTRRDGAEVSLQSRAFDRLTLKGSYTYMKARVREGAFGGRPIPNVPEHKASAEVTSNLGAGFTATLIGVYVGERPFISDYAHDLSDQQSYFIMNMKLAYRWKSFRAFFDINNLTNKEYSEYGAMGVYPTEKSYYPAPKRNVLAGLSVTF